MSLNRLMIGFLIATHGKLAEGLLDSATLIVGKQEQVNTMSITHETNIEEFGEEMVVQIQQLDLGDGVIVFTDLLLASPYNQAGIGYKKIQESCQYRVISGTNLPILLEAFSERMRGNTNLDEVVDNLLLCGKEGIKEFFKEFQKYSTK